MQGSTKLPSCTALHTLLMMTAEFMLSKRPVLRFTAALFFLLKLFSSHIYCKPYIVGDFDVNVNPTTLTNIARTYLHMLSSNVCRMLIEKLTHISGHSQTSL